MMEEVGGTEEEGKGEGGKDIYGWYMIGIICYN
jgi:hypothetical protein